MDRTLLGHPLQGRAPQSDHLPLVPTVPPFHANVVELRQVRETMGGFEDFLQAEVARRNECEGGGSRPVTDAPKGGYALKMNANEVYAVLPGDVLLNNQGIETLGQVLQGFEVLDEMSTVRRNAPPHGPEGKPKIFGDVPLLPHSKIDAGVRMRPLEALKEICLQDVGSLIVIRGGKGKGRDACSLEKARIPWSGKKDAVCPTEQFFFLGGIIVDNRSDAQSEDRRAGAKKRGQCDPGVVRPTIHIRGSSLLYRSSSALGARGKHEGLHGLGEGNCRRSRECRSTEGQFMLGLRSTSG